MNIKPLSMTDHLQMIKGVQGITPSNGAAEGPAQGGADKVSFGDFLMQQLEEVNKQGIEAEESIRKSVTGQEPNPHTTMIAIQKADISLTLLMSVKERIERAYQELVRMPI